jgi:2-polyprenyl-6-methoxyphenol hydroxylase-like FAD-dependent oxidoreductase
LIIGAGIGGLAAGLSLRRAGWDIRISERAASPRELGFGLGLAPNALSALHELGVAEHVVRAGARLAKIELRRANGRVLRRFNVKVGLPAVVALRSDLHGALLAAVGDDALRLSKEAVSFSESRRGVTRDALRTWGEGHVTLLGDAAHLLMPHTGQGAAQALEDAVALGLAMAGPGSVEQALRRYEAVRARRTRAFIRLGPRIARVTTTSNVAIKAVRSLALRLTPERLLALSARGFQRDPHRELRSRPAA